MKGDLARGALKDAKNVRLLEVMCKIFILESLNKDNGILSGAGYMTRAAHTQIIQALDVCIKEIRPQMVSLVELQGYPDELVCSAIGNSYGDCYEK